MSFRIKEISVWGLFGCYNYEGINLEDNFILFYGDNGAGKTTLINIIFEFFSMTFYSKRSKTRELYKKIQIEFENGAKYEVEENVFRVYDNGLLVFEEDFTYDCTIEMQDILKNINNEVLYITDNRELLNITPDKKISVKKLYQLIEEIEGQFRSHYRKCWERNVIEIDEILAVSMKRVCNDISKEEIDKLIKTKEEILSENRKMSNYGLTNYNNVFGEIEFQKMDVINLLQFYNFYQTNNTANLAVLYNRIDRLITEVNNYLIDKCCMFDIENGFYIIHERTNKRIDIDWLSSGEKNLIRILFSCMLANDKSGVFFIDEPELSLNMKWLEQIEGSLKRINNSNNNLQFIICTHSFDIISQNMEQVYKFKG